MPQRLILSVNQTKVTASYQNTTYKKTFGFEHWGFDSVSSVRNTILWAQGEGITVSRGLDNNYGNFVVIFYPDVLFSDGSCHNVIANYFHMAKLSNLNPGDYVNNNTSQIGIMGTTGTYSTGVHLHTEMRRYRCGDPLMASPFGTTKFTQNKELPWFNPLDVIYCKSSSPDNQSYSTAQDQYINVEDLAIRGISDRGLVKEM